MYICLQVILLTLQGYKNNCHQINLFGELSFEALCCLRKEGLGLACLNISDINVSLLFWDGRTDRLQIGDRLSLELGELELRIGVGAWKIQIYIQDYRSFPLVDAPGTGGQTDNRMGDKLGLDLGELEP